MRLLKYLILSIIIFFISCQSNNSNSLKPGLQDIDITKLPSSIIAVPVFAMPDPSMPEASVDNSVLETENLRLWIEEKIIDSLKNQPKLNGYSFSAVKKAIHTQDKNNVWIKLNTLLHLSAAQLYSTRSKDKIAIIPACAQRKNFLEFYSYCLANNTNWLDNLNILSMQVRHADSAFIVVITQLENNFIQYRYQIKGGLAVLLVDTNNGKLLWGNYANISLDNPAEKKYFPNWKVLFSQILRASFWQNLPGFVLNRSILSPNLLIH